MQSIFSWLKNHERHLSALAMVAGFVTDNLVFSRIDLWQTQAVFIGYITICFVTIPLWHALEIRAEQGKPSPRARLLLPLATQFALGGFWSGFVIFYGRAADWSSSWPFVLFLIAVFLGNEYFRRYHGRLVFTSVLFFLALYAYAIFAIPIVTGTISRWTFLASGLGAIAVFALFTVLLRLFVRERFTHDIWRIRLGAFGVLALMNLFYFTSVLPPLPLAAPAAGIYHDVSRVAGTYQAVSEEESWRVRFLNFPRTLHVAPGEPLAAYSAVFAPTALTTAITHRWEWYDPRTKTWVLKAAITYPIAGGRDDGYRGYSTVTVDKEGQWRVSVITSDGLRIRRLPFTVAWTDTPLTLMTITLK